jgi:hypothetical protein
MTPYHHHHFIPIPFPHPQCITTYKLLSLSIIYGTFAFLWKEVSRIECTTPPHYLSRLCIRFPLNYFDFFDVLTYREKQWLWNSILLNWKIILWALLRWRGSDTTLMSSRSRQDAAWTVRVCGKPSIFWRAGQAFCYCCYNPIFLFSTFSREVSQFVPHLELSGPCPSHLLLLYLRWLEV